jgi:glycosyltransferase 2 family protein
MTVRDDATQAVPTPPAEGAAPRSSRLRSWLRAGVLLLMLVSVAAVIAANRDEVAEALRELSPGYAVAALPGAFGAMIAALFVWRSLLADLGARVSVPDAARVFYLSQLGKYVPGSVWSMVAQVELSRDLHIPRRTSVSVGVLSIAVSITVGLTTGSLVLLVAAPDAARRYWWILFALPVLLTVLHPRVLARCLNLVYRLTRRPPLPKPPSWAGLSRAAGSQLLVWLALGLHIWPLLVGMGADAGQALLVAIGGYALAYSIGQLAVGLPAGAGVREAVLTLSFAPLLDGGAPAALVVALLSRMTLILVDLAMAGGQRLLTRRPLP